MNIDVRSATGKMPDVEPEKKAIKPSQSVDGMGRLGATEDIDSIPDDEFEITGPQPITPSPAQSMPSRLQSAPIPAQFTSSSIPMPSPPDLGNSASGKQTKSDFLFGFGDATQAKLKVVLEDVDLLDPSANPPNLSGKTIREATGKHTSASPGEMTAKVLAFADATTMKFRALLHGSKPDLVDYEETHSDSSETGKSAPPELWTLPESKLTQQERKLKKQFLHKAASKSKDNRPTKTRTGTHSRPEKVNPIAHWIRAHKLKLAISALAIVLLFIEWQLGHSAVAQFLVNNGIEQLSHGHSDDALSSFNQAIQVDGQSAGAYFSRGNVYWKKGELKKAFDDYSMASKLSPKRVDILSRRAALSLQLEKYELAAHDYTQLFQLAPKDIKPQMYNNRADAYVGLRQYDKAWQDYNRVLQINPYDYDSYLGRGYCYLKQKKFTEATKDFQTVLRHNPDNKAALCYRAQLYADQGLSSEAFADLAAVLQLDPNYGRAFKLRAELYSKKGNYVEAINDFNEAQKTPLFKRSLALLLDRASVYEKMKNFEKAAADYGSAIAVAPNDSLPYLARAQCYEQLKDYKHAIADCTTAAEISPKTAAIYQLRGTMHEQFGNPISAYKDYTKAISLDSKNADSYLSRGNYSLAKQDFAAALADFQQALKIDPQNAAAQAGRKQVLAATAVPKPTAATVFVPPGATSSDTANLDLNKVSTADLIKDGYDRLHKGSAEQSIPMLSEAVRRNRNDPMSRRYLGYALLQADRPAEAVGQFEALSTLRSLLPADQQAMRKALQSAQSKLAEQSKSNLAEQSKQPDQTKESGESADVLISKYRAALAANPKDWSSKYKLAELYSKSGRTDDAVKECMAGMTSADPTSEEQQKFCRLYSSLSSTKPGQMPVSTP